MNATSKAKAGAVAAIVGALSAVITTGLYLALVYTQVLEPIRWWAFGLHLAIALLGGLANLAALVLGRWWSLLPLTVCAYFILIQLGGL